MRPLPDLAADPFTRRELIMQILRLQLLEEGVQRVLTSSEWPNQEPAVFDRKIDRGAFLDLGLGGK